MPMNPRGWTRTVRGLITITFVLVLLFALEVFSRFLLEGSVADGPRQMVEVSIPENATITQIGAVLYDRKLIEHPLLFRYAVRIMGADTKIRAGNMMLASGQSLLELIRNLTRTKALGTPVTIPEGRTAADVAEILRDKLGVDSSMFMGVVTDTEFVRSLGLDGPSLEGYLYPDTYFIAIGSDSRRIASRMVANFRNHLPKDFDQQAEAVGMSMHEVLTLASIVEWETYSRDEATLISSVYHNRLKRGMPLQADPTVSYALGKGPARLYYSDLKVDSPYNTYRNTGLPPGPIDNPGLPAIRAALNPAATNYLYFVARGDGTHIFTTNLADHLIAKQQLDRLRREHARTDTATAG
jgi:UPF0755 protein